MYLGRIVELGSSHAVFDTPLHPYTVVLLSGDVLGFSARREFEP
jgi:ABC-type oligopeptide transport system ATPase subunit